MLGLVLAAGVAAPPPIVITGRALADDQSEEVRDVVRIDRRTIERVPSARIEDVLQQVAGVQSFRRAGSRSAHPTAGGITMRGLGGNAASRALLVIDGVPQQDPFGGWIAFPAIQTDLVGRIAVTRGGGAVRWGPGALAGMVEVDSLAPGEADGAAAVLRTGSRRALDVRLRSVAGTERAYLLGGIAFARSDGFVPIVAEDRGAADRVAPYRQASARLRGGALVAPDLELQAGVSLVDDARSRGLRDSDNRLWGSDQSLRLVGRGDWPFALTMFAQQRRFDSDFAAADAGRATSRPTLAQRIPATGHGARFELAPQVDALSLRLGGDLRAGRGETRERFAFVGAIPSRRREAGGGFRTAGLFAEASVRRDAVTIEAAVRLDRWRLGVGRIRETSPSGALSRDERFAARSGSQPSWRLGGAVALSSAWSLRASAYSGWRLPTLNELYRPFRLGADAVAANPELKPEQLRGAELGMRLARGGGLTLSLTGFAARLDEAIANVALARGPGVFPGVGFVPAGGTYFQRRNLRAIDSRGLEVDAEWQGGRFDARLSAALTRSRVRGAGDAAYLDRRRPPQTPALTAVASGGWTGANGARLGLNARFVSRQFEDDLERQPLRSAFALGATVSWPLADRLALDIALENATGARIETGVGGDGAVERAEPRTLWIGLALR